MTEEHFDTLEIRECFNKAGLNGFEEIWSKELPYFEEPNIRRNGKSGVARHTIKNGDNREITVFIKRQENHNFKSWRHPVHGEPTFVREYKGICRLRELEVPTVRPLYFGTRKSGHNDQAILITRALDEFYPLAEWDKFEGEKEGAVIKQVAIVLSKMHNHKIQHSGLYDKHIFACIDKDSGEAKVKLVDLEKSRYAISRQKAAIHDLDQILRHSPAWNKEQKKLLVECYLEGMPEPKFNRERFIYLLENRTNRKQLSRSKKKRSAMPTPLSLS